MLEDIMLGFIIRFFNLFKLIESLYLYVNLFRDVYIDLFIIFLVWNYFGYIKSK